MLKVTSRYLAYNFIPPFVIGFIFFVAFLNTFYMFRVIDLIVTKGIDVSTVFMLVVNLSVTFFSLAVPLSVFFATIYTLNKLSDDSEIIAMRSFGMTKFKIYLPFLIVSCLIASAILSFDSYLIPKANTDFKNTIIKLTSTGMLTSIREGQFFTDIPNATLFSEKVSTEGNNFENIFIHLNDKTTLEQRVIFANSGSLIKFYGDKWHAPNLRLHLTDGNIVKLNSNGDQIEKILFHEYDFPIFSADFGSSVLNKDSMKTNWELSKSIDEKKKDYIYTERIAPKDNDEINKRIEAKKSIVKSQIEYFARFITFPQIVFFVLLGFSLGIKNVRGNGNNNTIKAVVILLSYYGIYFLLLSLAQRGMIGAAVASFTPSALLSLISIYYYSKLDWVA